jgi:hypothetical protein
MRPDQPFRSSIGISHLSMLVEKYLS